MLAAAVFTSETGSGWQQVTLTTPVPIRPNTMYVASYHTDAGYYFADRGYFSGQESDSGPLHAPADAPGSPNGVFVYGASGFPTKSWEASNYWADVVFTTAPTADTLPPVVIGESPAPGATGLLVNLSALTVSLSEPIQPPTISLVLRDARNQVVPSSTSYNPSTLTVTLTPTVTLAASSQYTATLSGVVDLAGNRMVGSFTWSFTTGNHLVCGDLSIPYFGANPTITSTRNGPWSDPNTWSAGRVPTTGDVVSIGFNTTVTYDVVSQAVLQSITIQSGATLAFQANVNTLVIAANYLVLPGGTLEVGTQANPVAPNVTATIMTANQALNTATDPEQYGDSLIGLGNVTIYGADKTPFGQLAVEPRAGDTTLTFANRVTGWQPGDELFLPDTRQLNDAQRGSKYVPQWETPTIASVSTDGLTVTLTSPLQFSHLGARDIHGNLTFLPQVADETRNVVIRSQNGLGNRGTVMFLQRANVDIHGAYFFSLGRTTINAFDDTTFNSSGQVTHIGTNQEDRTPVNFLNLWGPTTAQADGYQYTFVDNVVDCKMMNNPHIWGIEVNNSSYGLIQGNVVDNWAGAGIALVAGSEVGNEIEGNFVMRINGTGQRGATGLDGSGYWSRNPDNCWANNVATDINQGGIYSYGFNLNASYLGTVNVPAYPGADPTQPGQWTLVDMNAIPLMEFSGNEVYGATPNGLTLWWIGTFFETPKGQAGTVQDFQIWNVHGWGYFGYETNQLVIDHFVARGDPNVLSNPYDDNTGLWFADYMTRRLVVQNANIQNMGTGIHAPINADVRGASGSNAGIETIENSYLANVDNIDSGPASSVNGSSNLAPIQVIVNNVTFGQPNVSRTFYNISEENSDGAALGTPNLGLLQVAIVTNYNGVAGDNFDVYPTRMTTYGTATMPLILGYVASSSSGGTAAAAIRSKPPAPTTPPVGPAILGTGSMPGAPTPSPSPQSENRPLSIVLNPFTSDPAVSSPRGIKLAATGRGSSTSTGGLVAGPLTLILPRRQPVTQRTTDFLSSPWT
jgi:hypothetical protein